MAARHGLDTHRPQLWPTARARRPWATTLAQARPADLLTVPGQPVSPSAHLIKSAKNVKKRCRRWDLNPCPDGRMTGDTGWSCLTSRTSLSDVFNIEYKLYICIYIFCKIKKYNRVEPEQHYGSRLQPKHDTSFLALASIRLFLRPHWRNGLNGVWGC
jgi:hypothetical protein